MSGKKKTQRGGTKRCAGPDHVGERWLKLEAFHADRTQPSGRKSRCKDCFNAAQNDARDTDGYRARQRELYDTDPKRHASQVANSKRAKRENAARRDVEDEASLDRAEAEARKILAASEARSARLASDFSNLKEDDFEDDDTSVANDRGPGAAKASREASAEKRQEYSRAMGQHATTLRHAALKSEQGGDIVAEMTPESGNFVGRLAEQERRFGNRRLARSVSLFTAGEELSRRLLVAACDQYLTGRVVATGYAARPKNAHAKRSVCLLLSDLHLGADLKASDNPMPYRKVEEARRLEYILRQALDYKPQYRRDSELVLMLNGDIIEGLLLHDYRDGAPLTEQKVIFLRYFERFVAECARAYPSVRVFCQPGNHGRNIARHPGRATSSKWDGIEWGLYYALSRACSALKNVTWDIPRRAVSAIDLHGSILGLTHADTEVKVGDPDTKAKENAQVLAEINSTEIYGVTFDAWAFGHFHKPRYQPKKIRAIYNGALVPPNGHARTSGYLGESCGQFLFEAVEGFPIGDIRFIEVGKAQDDDERLGTIIEPFRFDNE